MTLHINIDKDTEAALAAIAKIEDLAVEDIAENYIKEALKARDAHMTIVREEIRKGFESPVVEDFSMDRLIEELDNETGS